MIGGTIDMRQFLSAAALGPDRRAVLTLSATAALAGPVPARNGCRTAAKFLPDGYVLGQVIATAPDGSEATVAVFPADANDPASPGSAFDPGQVLELV